MSEPAGPAGTGLIPPGVVPPNAPPADQPTPEPPPDNPPGDPPPTSQHSDTPSDPLSDVPPVPDGDEQPGDQPGEPSDDDEGFIDPNEFRQQILDDVRATLLPEIQTRFDRAITRLSRNRGQEPPPDPDAPPADPATPGTTDVTSLRLLGREMVREHMVSAGRQEQTAVARALDSILPTVNWQSVGDPEEYVEKLVRQLAGTTEEMIKVGADRKVRQLRTSGHLAPAIGQPGTPGSTTTSVDTGMAKGKAVAVQRWPGGRRRIRS